jgi:hypothetical protein
MKVKKLRKILNNGKNKIYRLNFSLIQIIIVSDGKLLYDYDIVNNVFIL